MWRVKVVASLLLLSLVACMPFATPPAVAEIGGTLATSHGAREKLSVGAHLGSLWHDPGLPVDIGVGYVRNGFAEGRPPPRNTLTNERPRVVPQGFYVEALPKIAHGEHWRWLAGTRVEMLTANGSDLVGVSLLARTRAELLLPVVMMPVAGVTRKNAFIGIAHGMLAVGTYAEAGYQRWPTGETGVVVGIGLCGCQRWSASRVVRSARRRRDSTRSRKGDAAHRREPSALDSPRGPSFHVLSPRGSFRPSLLP